MQSGAATGYGGVLSLEILNDQFRAGSATRTAIDGVRSLVLLEEQLAATFPAESGEPLTPKAKSRGVSFVEFAVNEPKAGELADLFAQLGFPKQGRHPSKAVRSSAQG